MDTPCCTSVGRTWRRCSTLRPGLTGTWQRGSETPAKPCWSILKSTSPPGALLSSPLAGMRCMETTSGCCPCSACCTHTGLEPWTWSKTTWRGWPLSLVGTFLCLFTISWVSWWFLEICSYKYCLSVGFQFNLMQFYFYSTFYNQIVSGCFRESEAQSLDPQVITVAREKKTSF